MNRPLEFISTQISTLTVLSAERRTGEANVSSSAHGHSPELILSFFFQTQVKEAFARVILYPLLVKMSQQLQFPDV